MRRSHTRTSLTAVAAAIVFSLVVLTTGAAGAAPVTNGDFEAGTLAGWQVADQPSSDGSWYAYSGTSAPYSNSVVPAPPQGSWAAVSDQLGHGSHALYRDLTIDAAAPVLSLRLYYVNQADHFTNGPGFDFTAGENQRLVVDIIRAGADPLVDAPADRLVPVFATAPGDPLSMPATTLQVDLSAHIGTTVRLRIVEVDTLQFFNVGVDAVALTGDGTPSPPPPPVNPALPVPAAPTFTG